MTKKLNETFGVAQAAVTAVASKVVTGQAGVDTTTLYNAGSTTVYVGPTSGVTAATGFPIAASAALIMETTADIYAITASGSSTLAILVEQ